MSKKELTLKEKIAAKKNKKAAVVEPEVKAKSKKSKEVVEAAVPEKKKKKTALPVVEATAKTKKELRALKKASKVAVELVEEEIEKATKGGKKSKKEIVEVAKTTMRSVVSYDDMMDGIEKKYDTNSSQLAMDPRAKLSTGLLVQDLVLSGGLLGGGWYTFFGQEQSAKSTLAMQSIIACLHTDVPMIQYWDYEGCYTFDTDVMIDGKSVPFSDLIPKEVLDNLPSSGFLNLEIPDVNTLGGLVKARVFYGGIKECLKVTTESGNTLEGSRHPFMVQLPDGNLAWKMIEELSVGDVVLQQR